MKENISKSPHKNHSDITKYKWLRTIQLFNLISGLIDDNLSMFSYGYLFNVP